MYSLTYLNSVQGRLTEQALNFQQNTPSSPQNRYMTKYHSSFTDRK